MTLRRKEGGNTDWCRIALAGVLIACFANRSSSIASAAALLHFDRVWDAAPHNAFTDLVRFDGKFFLAFREASAHEVPPAGSPGGNLRVLESSDGLGWTSAALLQGGTNLDLRDAKLAVTPQGQLMLSGAAVPQAAGLPRQTQAWFSDDGATWSAPQPIGDANYWLWGVQWHEGAAYSVGYGPTTSSSSSWNTRLYSSTDGASFGAIVPTLNFGSGPNETALLFREDDTAVALVRRDSGSQSALVGTSSGDYTQWTWHDTGVRVGGPELIEIPDGRIVAATRLYDGGTRTSLSFLDPQSGSLSEFMQLPSGGDTSYAGMVWHEDHLWVSYYSSHEGKANIYVAEVDVLATPSIPPMLHVGAADPVIDSWLPFNGSAGVAFNGPVDDAGTPAWNVTDASTVSGSREAWVRSLTPDQLVEAASGGWKMSGRLRVVNAGDAPDGAIELSAFLDSSRGYVLSFGSDAAGHAVVGELVGTAATGLTVGRTATLATGGYHDYEMVYDPSDATVDVYADGMLVIADYVGMLTSSTLNRVLWGSNASAAVGSGNYARVEFEVFGDFATVAADLNWDGAVDIFDVNLVSAHWGSSGPAGIPGDANRDGAVDIFDVNAISQNWSANAEAVAEPATLGMCYAGVVAACVLRIAWAPALRRRQASRHVTNTASSALP